MVPLLPLLPPTVSVLVLVVNVKLLVPANEPLLLYWMSVELPAGIDTTPELTGTCDHAVAEESMVIVPVVVSCHVVPP